MKLGQRPMRGSLAVPARLSRGAGSDRGKGWERGGKPAGQGSHPTQADLTKALSGPGALRPPPVRLSSPLSGGNIWALCTARLTPCWSGWGRAISPRAAPCRAHGSTAAASGVPLAGGSLCFFSQTPQTSLVSPVLTSSLSLGKV